MSSRSRHQRASSPKSLQSDARRTPSLRASFVAYLERIAATCHAKTLTGLLQRFYVFSAASAATSPSWTLRPANSTTVPLRSYSNSRRSGVPGTAGWLGLMRALAWMGVFSSTDHTMAFS